ncbi:hypothetical protein [Agrobacterium sp. MS2]|uniref:hypothetical protein n=1 Tax=Agrobacterium sp. MS2 TaxID=1345498 RepID=UPI000DBF8D5D|nr:hypothetical protein [Agrobacterium sp. MS2]RAL95598.1 hypothetical protein DOU54_20795 [Agrobacterium sp. MS2]
MTEFTRRERIRTILIEEFKGDGHELFEHEGETYARLPAPAFTGKSSCASLPPGRLKSSLGLGLRGEHD